MVVSRRGFVVALPGLGLAACGSQPEPSAGVSAPGASAAAKVAPEAAPEVAPEVVPAPASNSAGALEAELAALRERFEARGWTVRAEPPFAVVGDGSPAQVERHASTTIRWAVRLLEAAYFEAPPDTIITVYLFETSESYERHVLELFGEAPGTPYGYYSPSDRALVMNIGTGGGTLVHEIVHPYMAANFPACPNWFDEGLASLYEQSAELEGRIVGLTNWRLAGLQDALRAGTVPSFEALCTSGGGFYSADPGTNYAQARYFCYWLQEQGLLGDFYRSFRAGVAGDPSGYATLTRFVGMDVDAFFKRWSAFTLGLSYP